MRSLRCPLILVPMLAIAAQGAAYSQALLPGSPDTVVASQGGATLTMADIDAFAARMPAAQRPGFFNSPTRIEGVITNLLTQKQLAAEARKEGLDRDPKVSRAVSIASDEVLGNAQLEHFRASVKVPDMSELAREQYIARKADFAVPGKLTVKHILISTKTHTQEEAKALADTVDKEAKAHPDQFDALIEKYSEDTSKATNHGVLEQVGEKGKYVPEFSKGAKALTKPGEVSPVVRTQFGFHVIQLVEREPDKQRSFEDVKADIVAKLQSDYVEKAVKDHSDNLRNQPMNADPAAVASLRDRFGVAPAVPSAAQPDVVAPAK